MRLSAAILAVTLAGCAAYSGYGLRPGASTESDVLHAMGRPALELSDRAGGRELFYPHGPLGTETYVAHVDAGGVLKGIDQVLDDDHFRRIREGESKDDVLHAIGPPGDSMRFGSGNYAWIYRFQDTWGYPSDFNVTFNSAGIVVAKIAIRLEHDRNGDR